MSGATTPKECEICHVGNSRADIDMSGENNSLVIDPIIYLPCGHGFHQKSVDDWIERTKSFLKCIHPNCDGKANEATQSSSTDQSSANFSFKCIRNGQIVASVIPPVDEGNTEDVPSQSCITVAGTLRISGVIVRGPERERSVAANDEVNGAENRDDIEENEEEDLDEDEELEFDDDTELSPVDYSDDDL